MNIEKSIMLLMAGAIAQCAFAEKKPPRPNIILILADDMGYSDPGCYGGEINTPNIDRLAANGLRFTQFYNASRSCPSRASLLTGVYAHQAGLAQNGRNLGTNAVTIAEVLKTAGYVTGMSGKWHLSETIPLKRNEDQLKWLSHQVDSGNFAPLGTYPHMRGFDDFWGIVWGVVDYFDPFSLVHNDEPIKEVPKDFYMTDFVTQKAVDLLKEFDYADDPFFMYVAYTSPHWPLHALPEDIEKYKGKYNDGWDSLRVRRYRKMLKLGLFDTRTAPLAKNESGLLWEDCKRKDWEAAHMEVHAAMVERMDKGIGRIMEELKKRDMVDNTFIIFMSDNGASPERGFKPGFDRTGYLRNGEPINYSYDRPGPHNTYGYLGQAWAGAVNSPFRYWKVQSYEGGMCTPMIVQWPAGLKTKPGSITSQPGHVMDILATCLDVTGAQYPKTYNGNSIVPMEGISLLPVLQKKKFNGHQTLAWEHEGGRAFRKGDWKISALRNKEWELFNLATDRTETRNLAAENPEKLKELVGLWEEWAKRMKIKL